jgi:hypothetical protein
MENLNPTDVAKMTYLCAQQEGLHLSKVSVKEHMDLTARAHIMWANSQSSVAPGTMLVMLEELVRDQVRTWLKSWPADDEQLVPAGKWVCPKQSDHAVAVHPQLNWPQCLVCASAPAYHVRHRYAVQNGIDLVLYVPTSETRIATGSAIVGLAGEPEVGSHERRVTVCYEGWVYDQKQASDPERWREAVLSAAGRLLVHYPTVARASLPEDSLQAVGTVTLWPRGFSMTVTDEVALRAWNPNFVREPAA